MGQDGSGRADCDPNCDPGKLARSPAISRSRVCPVRSWFHVGQHLGERFPVLTLEHRRDEGEPLVVGQLEHLEELAGAVTSFTRSVPGDMRAGSIA